MKKRRILALVLSVVMVLTMLASCKSEAEEDKKEAVDSVSLYTEPGTYPIVTEQIELEIFMPQTAVIEDYETNGFTLHWEDLTGIDFSFNVAASDAVAEKINILLATNDYPDMFMNVSIDGAKYGTDEGVLIDLTELLETKTPLIKAEMDARPTMRGQMTAVDGNIYSIPEFNECYHCSFAKRAWANTAILEELGEEMPNTLDEFYNACVKFKAKYPDGVAYVGAPGIWEGDIIPIIANAFTYISNNKDAGLRLNNGTVESYYQDPKFRDALAYLNKLYNEDILDETSFTNDTNQIQTIVDSTPTLFIASANIQSFVDNTNEKYSDYAVFPALEGPDGARYVTHIPQGMAACVYVTDTCEYPEAAVRAAEYFFTLEGSNRQGAGEKGIGWDDADEGAVGIDGKPALYKRIVPYSLEPQNKFYQDVGLRWAPSERRFGQQMNSNVDLYSTEGFEKLLYEGTKNNVEPYYQTEFESLPVVNLSVDEANALKTKAVEVKSYTEQSVTSFVVGNMDIDTDWDGFVKSLDDIGMQDIIDTYQIAYDRQYK